MCREAALPLQVYILYSTKLKISEILPDVNLE